MDARREIELAGTPVEGEGGEDEEKLLERLDEERGTDDDSVDPDMALDVSNEGLPLPRPAPSPTRDRRRPPAPSSPEVDMLDTLAMLPALPPIDRILVVLAVLLASNSGLLSLALGERRWVLRPWGRGVASDELIDNEPNSGSPIV